jgi:hypothetical protein
VVNCTGDISGGVGYDGNSVTTLNVNSLTTNVTPSGGVSGLSLTARADDGSNGRDGGVGIGTEPGDDGNGANNLNLTYSQPGANPSGGNSGAFVTANAAGIVVTSPAATAVPVVTRMSRVMAVAVVMGAAAVRAVWCRSVAVDRRGFRDELCDRIDHNIRRYGLRHLRTERRWRRRRQCRVGERGAFVVGRR